MKSSSVQLRRQKGAIAILTGLMIVVLIGMAGLVLDLAHLYIVKTELQNAADACALSAARELSAINAGTVARARSAGIEAGRRNLVNFQSVEPVILDADIKFGADLTTDAEGRLLNFTDVVDNNTQYARCAPHEAQPMSVVMWFMGVLGIYEKNMTADAVSKYPKSAPFCAIPMAMCIPSGGPFTVGTWYEGREDSQGNIQGSFGWLQFSPTQHGSSDLKDIIAGEGICDLENVRVSEDNGAKTGVDEAWNTRFGIYKGAFKLPKAADDRSDQIQTYKPDLTGKAYNPADYPGGHVYSDYKASQLLNTPYIPGTFPKENFGEVIKQSEYRDTQGGSRRMVSMPVVACESISKTPVKPDRWACALMVHPMADPNDKGSGMPGEIRLEFVGYSDDPACAGERPNSAFPKLVR